MVIGFLTLCAQNTDTVRGRINKYTPSAHIEGTGVDAKGIFLAGVHAGPVYEIVAENGLSTHSYPTMGTTLTSGEIAFTHHAGENRTGPNRSTWTVWAHRYGDH